MFVLIWHSEDNDIRLCGVYRTHEDAISAMREEFEQALIECKYDIDEHTQKDYDINSKCHEWGAWVGRFDHEPQAEWIILAPYENPSDILVA